MNKKSIWIIVLLVSGYIALQLIADITAAKIVQIGNITLPAGTLVFAITFTWRDMIHKKLGKEWAKASIYAAAGMNIFMVLYFIFAIELKPAVFWTNQEAFASVLSVVPRIAIASILSEAISALIDTEIYQYVINLLGTKHQWVRVLGSNLISLPVDSLIFNGLAFFGLMPISAILALVVGQIIFKSIVTLVSMPAIYFVKDKNVLQ